MLVVVAAVATVASSPRVTMMVNSAVEMANELFRLERRTRRRMSRPT